MPDVIQTQDILAHALLLGFDIAGVIPVAAARHAAAFADWLAAGYHGEMAYLAARAAERADPARFAPDARSMILLATSYAMDDADSGIVSGAPGRIARYACGPDYHDIIKPRLYALDAFIRERTGRATRGKVFVDSAPVLERDFAAQAGLGFIGRNCCLITPGLGSWTVLAGVMVPEELEVGSPMLEIGSWKLEAGNVQRKANLGCGRCTRCLDACPTRAFVAPHVLDARRCIAYLTIELRGPIPRELRPLVGGWVFGCDVCQEVCPYNTIRHARCVERVGDQKSATANCRRSSHAAGDATAHENVMQSGLTSQHASRRDPSEASLVHDRDSEQVSCRNVLHGTDPLRVTAEAIFGTSIALGELLALDETRFRSLFRGTPVLRVKRRGLVRNACVAAGNSGDASLVPLLVNLLADPEPLVRGHAAWALGRLGGAAARRALELSHATEADPWVRDEIAHSALTSTLSS